MSARTVEDTRKAEALKAAVAWISDHHGPAATVEAFGDPEPINEAWEREHLEGFRAYLWERYKASRRGVA